MAEKRTRKRRRGDESPSLAGIFTRKRSELFVHFTRSGLKRSDPKPVSRRPADEHKIIRRNEHIPMYDNLSVKDLGVRRIFSAPSVDHDSESDDIEKKVELGIHAESDHNASVSDLKEGVNGVPDGFTRSINEDEEKKGLDILDSLSDIIDACVSGILKGTGEELGKEFRNDSKDGFSLDCEGRINGFAKEELANGSVSGDGKSNRADESDSSASCETDQDNCKEACKESREINQAYEIGQGESANASVCVNEEKNGRYAVDCDPMIIDHGVGESLDGVKSQGSDSMHLSVVLEINVSDYSKGDLMTTDKNNEETRISEIIEDESSVSDEKVLNEIGVVHVESESAAMGDEIHRSEGLNIDCTQEDFTRSLRDILISRSPDLEKQGIVGSAAGVIGSDIQVPIAEVTSARTVAGSSPNTFKRKSSMHKKIFQHANSPSYRRLLPFLMDLAKDSSYDLLLKPQLPTVVNDAHERPSSLRVPLIRSCTSKYSPSEDTASSMHFNLPYKLKSRDTDVCTDNAASLNVDQGIQSCDTDVSTTQESPLKCHRFGTSPDKHKKPMKTPHSRNPSSICSIISLQENNCGGVHETCRVAKGMEASCSTQILKTSAFVSSLPPRLPKMSISTQSGHFTGQKQLSPSPPPSKGILKVHNQQRKDTETCQGCASVSPRVEKAFSFSQKQMQDAQEVAMVLMKELSCMRNAVHKLTAPGYEKTAAAAVGHLQAKEICRKSLEAEDKAKSLLKQMNQELSLHCKTNRRRVKFADPIEQKLLISQN